MPLTNDHAAVLREARGLKLGLRLHLQMYIHTSCFRAYQAGADPGFLERGFICVKVCVYFTKILGS